MVLGSTSPTFTPPEVTIASVMGRGSFYVDGKSLQSLQQPPALLTGHVVGLPVSGNLGQFQQHRHQQPGRQSTQQIVHVPVGVLTQLPQKALVQLLPVQGGLEVNDAGVLVLLEVPHVCAGAEHQGT